MGSLTVEIGQLVFSIGQLTFEFLSVSFAHRSTYERFYFVFEQKLIHTSTFSAVWEPKRTFFAPILRIKIWTCVFSRFLQGWNSPLKSCCKNSKFLRAAYIAAYQIEHIILSKCSNETEKFTCESLYLNFL